MSIWLVLISVLGWSEGAPDLGSGKWLDLTYAFDEQTVYWPTAEGFRIKADFVGMTEKGYYYEAFSFCGAEHGGTHLDAPIHFAKDQWTVDEIPVDRLIGPAIVVDVTAKAGKDRDYQVSVGDLEAFEKAHGRIADGVILLLRTGNGAYYPDREKYMGTAERGAEAVAKLHFPGLHPDAARWLVANRSIKAVGLDTPSIDYGQSTLFETHRVLYQHNIPAFENVAHLDKMPQSGAWVIALPMKIGKGSGAPLRIVALLP